MPKTSLVDLLAGTGDEQHSPQVRIVQDQREKLIALWTSDPWAFLTGTDVDGRPVYWTKDERHASEPVRPFPDWPYLRELVHAFHAELKAAGESGRCRTIGGEKPRQMTFTTTVLGFFNWNCMFHKGRRWLVSKQTEGEAADLIRDKVRFPCSQMPEWLRKARGPRRTPVVRCDYPWSESHILAVGENAADTEFRGGTSTGGLVDEAAFQKRTREIYAAARPQASLMILVTTPNIGNDGATAFREMFDINKPEKRKPAKEYQGRKGIEFSRTSKGYLFVHLDYFARPDKDAAWAAAEEAATTQQAWRRENLVDWSSSAGKVYYPEFCKRPAAFIRPTPGLLNAPLIRCFDFGFNNPAIVTFQYDARVRRVWVQRELKPTGINTYAFAALVRWLCGETSIDTLDPWERALEIARELDEAALAGEGPLVPWFQHDPRHPIQFLNYCGHESQKGQSAGTDNDTKATTDGTIFEASGIPLSWAYTLQVKREQTIRRLLCALPDGHPGMLFDPFGCPLLIDGFGGGIVYPDATKENPDPSDPKKDNVFSHLHEALGYGLVQYVPLADGLVPPDEADLVVGPHREIINAREMEAEGFAVYNLNRGY